MKKQIEEVQRYFVDKIENCEFELVKIEKRPSRWHWFLVTIDGYDFAFSVHPKNRLFCLHTMDSFITIPDIPNEQLDKLIALIERKEQELKAEKIEKLKKELEELQS